MTKRAAVLLGCSLATAASADTVYDSAYVAADLVAVQHEDRLESIDNERTFGLRAGIGIPVGSLGMSDTALEIGVFANRVKFEAGDDGSQIGLMADLIHAWDLGGVDPYVLGGIGAVAESYRTPDLSGAYLAIEAGVGLAWELTGGGAVRTGITAQSVHNDEFDTGEDPYIDWRFNIGFAFPVAGSPAPAAPVAKAVDSDGDGLIDSQDKCPSTPASTADGCPAPAPVVQTDSDSDGVADSADQCAGTLSGLKVDSSGCAVQTEAQSVVLKGVTFLPGSATLTAEAKTVLDTAAASLSADKSLKVELGGHTDAQGADAANLKLSQRRADSARQYLIGKGVEADRLTAKGYGETQPIADNNTVEGRAENRRVELKVVK